ncbi:MAG: hypothetical protein H6822_06755 [Planctomycetaceae bacterium]|nr:hypothetical protein [Planctomycetales bacterium]MCB9921861.1 hypothetical protein [Planctomycetaceae bacterium]
MPSCPSCNNSVSTSTTLCRSCGSFIPESSTRAAELEQQVSSLLAKGLKLEAVKVYREQTGSSLKDAKDAVEALQRGAKLPSPSESDADLDAQLLRLLGEGEKIKAVKLYRAQTGETLFDSKQAVEALAERHGIKVEGGGCSGVLVLSIAVLIAIAIVAGLVILQK